MATVTATLAPGAGYDNITLTSWAGDASLSPAPVAGGQIEHVDTITVDATGVVTGPDGDYTLLYISPTGAAQAIEYLIGEPAESATVSAVLSSGAGWDYVTLTSWSGDAAFSTTPVAGGQIEGFDALTLNTDGTVSGADGSYPLLYIAPDGQFEGITYTIGTSDETGPVIDTLTATGTDPDTIDAGFDTNEDNGTAYFFASASNTETVSAIKAGAQGSQAVTAIGEQSLVLTLDTGTYYIHALHEDDAGNASNILVSSAITLAELDESATVSATLSGGAGYTTATLAQDFDQSAGIFQNWPAGTPASGWQIETLTVDGWVDDQGQYWGPEGGSSDSQDVWVIQPDGTVTFEQLDTTGLSRTVQFAVAESVQITPEAVFQSLRRFATEAELAVTAETAFQSLRRFATEDAFTLQTAGSLASAVLIRVFAVTETITFSQSVVFQARSEIVPSEEDAGGFTDIVSKSSHILTAGEDQEVIPVVQNAWRQLEFPITVNGEPPGDVNELRFTIYLDGQIFKVFEKGFELAYIDGTIFLVLDEDFTATLSNYNYQFELWFTDSENNAFFVMQGEMQIKHTQANFL